MGRAREREREKESERGRHHGEHEHIHTEQRNTQAGGWIFRILPINSLWRSHKPFYDAQINIYMYICHNDLVNVDVIRLLPGWLSVRCCAGITDEMYADVAVVE